MPRRASGAEWINCTHPRQLRTADVRRIISVNAQLSRRRSSGKVAPKRLKSVSDGATIPRRRSSNNSKVDDARHGVEIGKILADREDEDRSPIPERETTPESVSCLSRTNSMNSDEAVEIQFVDDGRNSLDILMTGTDSGSPFSWDSKSRSTSPTTSPQSLLDSGLLDPFSTGIVPITREMNDLLLHREQPYISRDISSLVSHEI
jgi:hypothetical protein